MYDVNKYYGNNKPQWSPYNVYSRNTDMSAEVQKLSVNGHDWSVFLADNVFSKEYCDSLISQFDAQEQYPVGVDGFCNAEDKAGSYRAMAWSPDVAYAVSEKLCTLMRNHLVIMDEAQAPRSWPNKMLFPFRAHNRHYVQLGSTPWLRFMKYKNGGMHTPHYDAPFECAQEEYITLFSWVLYLNTPKGQGGEFQFVKDTRNVQYHPHYWDRSDWTGMSDNATLQIPPQRGRLLVFPHWLCHQVQQYIGEDYRYIIRGDVAYGY